MIRWRSPGDSAPTDRPIRQRWPLVSDSFGVAVEFRGSISLIQVLDPDSWDFFFDLIQDFQPNKRTIELSYPLGSDKDRVSWDPATASLTGVSGVDSDPEIHSRDVIDYQMPMNQLGLFKGFSILDTVKLSYFEGGDYGDPYKDSMGDCAGFSVSNLVKSVLGFFAGFHAGFLGLSEFRIELSFDVS